MPYVDFDSKKSIIRLNFQAILASSFKVHIFSCHRRPTQAIMHLHSIPKKPKLRNRQLEMPVHAPISSTNAPKSFIFAQMLESDYNLKPNSKPTTLLLAIFAADKGRYIILRPQYIFI